MILLWVWPLDIVQHIPPDQSVHNTHGWSTPTSEVNRKSNMFLLLQTGWLRILAGTEAVRQPPVLRWSKLDGTDIAAAARPCKQSLAHLGGETHQYVYVLFIEFLGGGWLSLVFVVLLFLIYL